jgi:hypothetical protein
MALCLATGYGFPPRLTRPRGFGDFTLSTTCLHLFRIEASQVGRAHGIARLDMTLLAAKSIFVIFLLTLSIRLAADLATASAGTLGVVLAEFVVHAGIKYISLLRADVASGFLSLYARG